ncbi:MAG: hypothetical protein C4519_07120 [Desulfobacteraceae bacterium]|nr:MAG: hypothetical protein C4519_07120 [Desulfobacteraceae bacterium]
MNLDVDAKVLSLSLDESPFSAKPGEETFQGWQLAEERMLLYLKSLQVAPEEQLGLALEAIRRAGAQRHAHSEPVSASLEALWQILRERCMHSDASRKIDIGGCNRSDRERPKWHFAFNPPQALNELAFPKMRRQCMISAQMELAPWRKIILNTIDAVRGPAEGLLYRQGSLLGNLVTLLAFIALQ